MSDENNEKKVHGIAAEYTTVDSLLAACNRVREAGYEKTDAFAPFPVHGIDKALGIKPTALPWIALAGGLTGTFTALVMQIWMNSYNYPYIISGKPYISLPAFIPVAFELTILFASFGAFFGMWALNKLPKFSNPVFTDPRFDRVTDDRFVVYIDAADDRYDRAGVEKLFADTGSQYIHAVVDDDSRAKVPRFVFILIGVLAALSIVPLLVVAKMRVTNSDTPRIHIFYDMDFSPAKDAQQTSTLFADGRAMRPDVPGTVARGQMNDDLNFLTGIDIDELARLDAPRAERLVLRHLSPLQDVDVEVSETEAADTETKPAEAETKAADAETKPADAEAKAADDESKPADAESEAADDESKAADTGSKAADDETKPADAEASPADAESKAADAEAKAADAETKAADVEPKAADAETKAADAETKAADVEPKAADVAGEEKPPSVMDTTPWLKENPLTVDEELIRRGQKYFGIYCSVCHGMNGGGNGLVNRRAQKILAATWIPPSPLHQDILFADKYPDGKLFNTISNGIRKMPGYSGQIRPGDRWAIVAYVRALQQSQDATIEMVPEDQRDLILARKAEVDKELAEQAEAERKKNEERAKKAEAGQAS